MIRVYSCHQINLKSINVITIFYPTNETFMVYLTQSSYLVDLMTHLTKKRELNDIQ